MASRPDSTIDLTDGKTRDVCTTVLPFQPLGVIDIFGNDTMTILPVSVG